MPRILLNGKVQEVSEQLTIQQLLEQLRIHPQQVAVAKNLEVIRPSELAITLLDEGDEIEIFHAVGGG